MPGFLRNLEYASPPAIFQVCFTLFLILAVVFLKKIKYSRVIGVEQNLNKTRVFNSSFTCGPGMLIFIGVGLLIHMCIGRGFSIVKNKEVINTLSILWIMNNLQELRLVSFLALNTFCALLPYLSSDHLRVFTVKKIRTRWQNNSINQKISNRVNPGTILNS